MQLKLTTDYAVRIIQYLCTYGRTSSGELSEQLGISQNYIKKIVANTKMQEFIDSCPGNQGGFQIKKEIKRIVLKEIVDAMEGNRFVNRCLEDEQYCEKCSSFGENCPIRQSYQRVQKIIDEQLGSLAFEMKAGEAALDKDSVRTMECK